MAIINWIIRLLERRVVKWAVEAENRELAEMAEPDGCVEPEFS